MKNTKWIKIAGVLSLACILWVGVAFAQFAAKVYMDGPDKQVVASGGEVEVQSGGTLDVDGTLNFDTRELVMVQYSADPNATSATVAVTGLDSGDYLIATQNTNNATGNLLRVVPGTGLATLYWSADPQAAVKVTVQTWQD